MQLRCLVFLLLFLSSSAFCHPIVILLTHPRSLSTAFEKIVRERKDVTVLHEPFTLLYYLHRMKQSREEVGFPAHYPGNYNELKKWLFSLSKEKSVFVKDMAFAALEYLEKDPEFIQNKDVHFMVLFRDPAKSLPSLYKIDPKSSHEFIGYEALHKITQFVPMSLYLEADELERDPMASYRAFCNVFQLEFSPHHLNFSNADGGEWDGPWYDKVRSSKQIERSEKSIALDKNLVPLFLEISEKDREHWLDLYRRQVPFFQGLKWR